MTGSHRPDLRVRPHEARDVVLRALYPFLLLSFCTVVCAQPLAGARHTGPGTVDASSALFDITLARLGESAPATEALVGELVWVQGAIRPEAAHVGAAADLYAVHLHAGTGFTMLDAAGRFTPWSGKVADLVPARHVTQLGTLENLTIFAGNLGLSGAHRLYLGYRPADGQLRYTPAPRLINVTNETPLDAARALYAARIAPDILPLCLRCHYAGGTAPTAVHVFTDLANPAHMELNIEQFRLLLQPPRGRDHVLSKVQGGRTHGGDVVVPANGDDFLALERFLVLLDAVPQ